MKQCVENGLYVLGKRNQFLCIHIRIEAEMSVWKSRHSAAAATGLVLSLTPESEARFYTFSIESAVVIPLLSSWQSESE